MTILNMTYWQWWSSVQVPLNSISNLAVFWWDTEATIKRTDPWNLTVNGVLLTSWSSTKLVRKVGSAPSDSSDWTLVVTETVADTYSSTWYTDTWLTNWTTYYYKAFAVGDNSTESASNSANVTPSAWWWQPWVNTLVYLPLNWDALDQSGNSRDGTMPSNTSLYSWEYINGNSWSQYYLAHWAWDQNSAIYGTYASTQLWNADRTICVWVKVVASINSAEVDFHYIGTANGGTQWWWFGVFAMYASPNHIGILRYYDDPYTNNFSYDNNWHNYIVTYSDTNKAKMYVDWQQVVMTANANVSFSTVGTNYYLWALRSSDTSKRIWLSKYIIEDKERTAQEISDYFDQTKWDYWIS